MRFPRLLPGAVLLLLAGYMPALETSVTAGETDGYVVVTGYMVDFNTGEMIRSLDSGGTLRVTWQFRLGNSDTSIVLFAHRDSLGEGYIVYSYESPVPRGPYSAGELAEEVSMLPSTALEGLGTWETAETLEYRLFLDYSIEIPPISLGGIVSANRERTGWQDLLHSGEGEP